MEADKPQDLQGELTSEHPGELMVSFQSKGQQAQEEPLFHLSLKVGEGNVPV